MRREVDVDAEQELRMQTTCPLEDLEMKETNPKDVVGTAKPRAYTYVPQNVMKALSLAMLEGGLKYGRHNYRVAGVRASVYVDAAVGHIMDWWEGEDIDPDSGLLHLVKGMASLTVLCDAIMNDMWDDDRPPPSDVSGLRGDMQVVMDDILSRVPVGARVKPYVAGNKALHNDG